MRSTAFAIITLAGGLLLVAAPAFTADDTEQRSTPAFETPGAQPAPETPTGHDPGPTPDPVVETDPAMRPEPAMKNDDPAQNDDPTMRNDDPAHNPETRGTTPSPQASPQAIGNGREYVVEQGDTLGEIARRELGSADKWREIARANGIEKPETLQIGQKLQIPGDASSAAPGEQSRL